MGCAYEETKNRKTYMDPFENGYCEECRKVASCTAYTKKEKRGNTWNSL